MAKSKNVRKQPEITPWKRWKLWLSRNEKVLWVGLLILIAPLFAFTGAVSSFLQPAQNTDVQTVYYGEDVTIADLKRASRFVGALRRIASSALAGASDLILGGPPDFNFDPYKYCLFKKKAARLGIRVSNTELGQRIQELWREGEATRLAAVEVSALPSGTNQQQQMMRFYQLRFEKQKELTDRGAFDSEGWKSLVKAEGQPLRSFEEMLREFYTIVKLQEYVGSSVKVSPQEVYDEFKKDGQKRLLSWVTWKPPTELTESISATATDADLKTYFESNKANFDKPLAVRASYVIVSKEHFETEAEKNLNDKDLEDYYSSNLNDYRTSAILAGEAMFALRTEEEQKEFEKALFKPFDEVKDDVREKVLEKKSRSELRSFTGDVRQKLFPAAGSDAKVPTLEELKAEYPHLTTGTTEYATRTDAEEVLGEAYSREVNRWFRELDPPNSRTPAKTEVAPPRWEQTVEAGKIFYTKVEARPAYQPDYDEVAAEVREEYTKTKALEAVAEALEKTISTDDATTAEKPSVQDQLESLLASGIEVKVGEETLSVLPTAPGLVTATEYVRSYGSLRYVPDPGEDAGEEPAIDEAEKDSTDDADDAEDEVDDGPKEEVQASSRQICDAAFDIEEEGQLAVARDPAQDACYLVRFDGVIYPDSSDFDTSKRYLESQLVREKRGIYLAEWHRQVVLEANPNAVFETAEAEAEEPSSEG